MSIGLVSHTHNPEERKSSSIAPKSGNTGKVKRTKKKDKCLTIGKRKRQERFSLSSGSEMRRDETRRYTPVRDIEAKILLAGWLAGAVSSALI